jgi:hypothetical protein
MADEAAPQDPQEPQEPATPDGTPEVDFQAEAEKWKQLARKHEKQAKDNHAAAQKLAELEKQNMSTDERFAEAQIRAVEAELMLTRYQVAASKGLNASDAQFLYGDTEEEIAAAADALLARLGTPKPATPDLKQGARGSAPRTDPNDVFRQAIQSRRVFG